MPLCEARCENSKMHLEECKVLRNSKVDESADFEDYDLVTPLRVLLMKKTDPDAYEAIHLLESNLSIKVLMKSTCPLNLHGSKAFLSLKFQEKIDLENEKLEEMTDRIEKYLKNYGECKSKNISSF